MSISLSTLYVPCFLMFMFEFQLRFNPFTIFWFKMLNFFQLILADSFSAKNQLIFGLTWA